MSWDHYDIDPVAMRHFPEIVSARAMRISRFSEEREVRNPEQASKQKVLIADVFVERRSFLRTWMNFFKLSPTSSAQASAQKKTA